MSLGPAEILVILLVALIVFGPQRLPEIARQVGKATRELRRMQDVVRGELEQAMHADYTPPNAGGPDEYAAGAGASPDGPAGAIPGADAGAGPVANAEDLDHAPLPQPPAPPDDTTDDGFAGPRSFN